MSYNNKNYGMNYDSGFANEINPYACFGNSCSKIEYNLFKPRLQDDSLYKFKHSVLDQYENSDLGYS